MDHNIAGDDARGRCRGILHVVKKGDTLYKIAKKYGVPLSRVMYANPYVDVYNLQIGDEICVPVSPRPPYPCYCPGCICPPGTGGCPGGCPGNRPPMSGNCPGTCPPGNRPPMPGNRPGNRPPMPDNRPGNRPPIPGNRPGSRPPMPDDHPGNRPPMPGNRPGNRPPMSGNCQGTCPPMQDNSPGNRPPMSGNRPPMPGNRQGSRPSMPENRQMMTDNSPGNHLPMPDSSPLMPDSRLPMPDNHPKDHLPMPDSCLGNCPRLSGDNLENYPMIPGKRPPESDDLPEMHSGDDMISSQPWDRMEDTMDYTMPSGWESDGMEPADSKREGNPFPSVSMGHSGNPYPSPSKLPGRMPDGADGMQDRMRNEVPDGMPNEMHSGMPYDSADDIRENLPGEQYETVWENMQNYTGGSEPENPPYGFADSMKTQKECAGPGCPVEDGQENGRMPWDNTVNAERRIDEYLMGMPRMENRNNN